MQAINTGIRLMRSEAMKWTADINQPEKLHCEIEYDNQAGYYLYVWKDGRGAYDYLQNTFDLAKQFALTKFGIPLDLWRQEFDKN